MKPYVVQRVVNGRGQVLLQARDQAVGAPIRPETSDLMRRLMSRVTEEGGTGTRAAVTGYTVAGKTGTAQKVLPGGGYSSTANIATFVGFLPAEDPQISIIVVVDEPQPEHTGGLVSAPVFRDIAEQAVRYLDIPPVPAERSFRFGDALLSETHLKKDIAGQAVRHLDIPPVPAGRSSPFGESLISPGSAKKERGA
jgi:cell division protein FtsI/penicillin-binding protein 2